MQNDEEPCISKGNFARKLSARRMGGVDGAGENSEEKQVSTYSMRAICWVVGGQYSALTVWEKQY